MDTQLQGIYCSLFPSNKLMSCLRFTSVFDLDHKIRVKSYARVIKCINQVDHALENATSQPGSVRTKRGLGAKLPSSIL